MITDPVGFGLDVGGLALGGIGLLRGVRSFKPGLARNPPAAERFRQAGQTIADDGIGSEGSIIRKSDGDEIFDPPDVPQRPISEDYKGNIETHPDGRLKRDMDGRELSAENIVGRQYKDGPDIPGTPTMVRRIAERLLGKKIKTVPPDEIDGDLGVTEFKIPPGTPTDMKISDRLMGDQRDKVIGHEAAHILEEVAGQIPTDGHEAKLQFIYNTTATGREGVPPKAPLEKLYDAENVPRELMAEAIRSYIVNPNWLKTVAPEIAALIRKHINEHPTLSKIIQFNSLAAGLGGAVLAGQSDESRAHETPTPPFNSPNPLKIAHFLFGPPVPFELANGTTQAASDITKIASELTRRGLTPQVPRTGTLVDIARTLVNITGRKKLPTHGPM